MASFIFSIVSFGINAAFFLLQKYEKLNKEMIKFMTLRGRKH